MIQEVIRNSIETKLNNNTQSKRFIVGSYAYLEDKQAHFIYTTKNGYKLIENNYIPCMMEFMATYQAIPTQINGNATIPITFLVQAEETGQIKEDIGIIEEVISKIVGDSETLVDGSKSYRSVWNMDAIQPMGKIELINGNYYISVSTTIYIDFSDTNYYGNAWGYKLNNNTLQPYEPKITRANEEDIPHQLGDNEARGGNKTSTWTGELTVYVDAFISALIDTFSSTNYDMERVYKFTESTPTRTTPLDISVRLQSAVYLPTLGEKTLATLVFMKADNDYVDDPTPPTDVKVWRVSTFNYFESQESDMKDTSESIGTGQPTELASDYALGFAMRKVIAEFEEGTLYSYWVVELE